MLFLTLVFLGIMALGSIVFLVMSPEDKFSKTKMRRSWKRTGYLFLMQSLTDICMLVTIGIMASLSWWTSSPEHHLTCQVVPYTDIIVLFLNSSVIFVLVWFRHFLIVNLCRAPVISARSDISDAKNDCKNNGTSPGNEQDTCYSNVAVFAKIARKMNQGPSIRTSVLLLMLASVSTIGYSFMRPQTVTLMETRPGFQFCVSKLSLLTQYETVAIFCLVHVVPALFVYCLYTKDMAQARKATVVLHSGNCRDLRNSEQQGNKNFFWLWLTMTSVWLPSLEAILVTAILSKSDMAFNFLLYLSYIYGCTVFLFSFCFIVLTFLDMTSRHGNTVQCTSTSLMLKDVAVHSK